MPTIVELNRGGEIPNLDSFDILISLGGPMEAWEEVKHPWLVAEKAAIREWVMKQDRPLLGICLGHQILADALGGKVGRAKRGEAGLTSIALETPDKTHPLYSGFGPSKYAINWHGSEVTGLPPEPPSSSHRVPIAPSRLSSLVQRRSACSIMSRPRVRLSTNGPSFPPAPRMSRNLHGRDAAPSVRKAVADAMPELWSNSRRFYDNFMRLAATRTGRTR